VHCAAAGQHHALAAVFLVLRLARGALRRVGGVIPSAAAAAAAAAASL